MDDLTISLLRPIWSFQLSETITINFQMDYKKRNNLIGGQHHQSFLTVAYFDKNFFLSSCYFLWQNSTLYEFPFNNIGGRVSQIEFVRLRLEKGRERIVHLLKDLHVNGKARLAVMGLGVVIQPRQWIIALQDEPKHLRKVSLVI